MVLERDTKRKIADEFVAIIKKSSLSKVRIADLIKSLGINRNTFYYHFANKYDVALWIFRSDLANELCNALPVSQLVYAPLKEGSKEELPYYVHIEIGARTLDSAPFFNALSRCVLSDQGLYRKLFNQHEVEFLTQIKLLWEPAFYNDIGFILDKRYMPPATQHMLANGAAHWMLSYIIHLLDNPKEAEILLDENANPFGNIIQESLQFVIQKHPINRNPTHMDS